MKNRLLVAAGAGIVALCSLHLMGVVVPEARADQYQDSRDISTSKAKSQLKGIRKDFDKIEEAMSDPRKLNNSSFFSRRAESIERNLERAAERDPAWDLSKERAHYESLKKRWAAAVAKVQREEMENSEPDIGDWDIPAFAGAERISTGAPTWCAGVEVPAKDGFLRSYPDLATSLDDDNLARAAQHACRAPKFAKRQAWTRVWRQALANKTGASAKLTEDFYKLWIRAGGRHGDSALRDATCVPYGERAQNRGGSSAKPDKASRASRRGRGASRSRLGNRGAGAAVGVRAESEMQAAFKQATSIGLGCKGNVVNLYRGVVNVDKLAWWIDQNAAPPSELVRAVFIIQSVGLDIGEEQLARGGWEADALKTLGTYALVSADIARLDDATFERELAAMNLNEWGQVMARMTYAKAKHVGRIYQAAFAKMDPGIRDLAFKVPAAAFADWERKAKANADGLALAQKIETSFWAKRTQDIRGCHDKAHGYLTKYLKKTSKPVASKEDRKALFDDPIANVLLQTSVVCAAYEGKLSAAAVLYNEGLGNVRTWRGPRFASYYAMLERYGDLKAKDPSFPLEDNQVGFWIREPNPTMAYTAYEQTFNKTGVIMARSGRIKSVKKTGKGTALTFKTESWKEPVWDCKETRKIDRITADGRIVYRQNCKKKGTKTVKSTVEPFTVPPSLAAGLKAGQFMSASVEFTKGGNIGIPLVVYKSKKQDKVLGALGVSF